MNLVEAHDRRRRRRIRRSSACRSTRRAGRPAGVGRRRARHPARDASRTRRSRRASCRRSRSTSRWSRSSASDAHVFFRVDATPHRAESLEDEDDDATDWSPSAARCFNARVDPRTPRRVGSTIAPRGRPVALPLLRRRDAARRSSADAPSEAEPVAASLALTARLVLTSRRDWLRSPRVTKQSETRDRVLDLIEQLARRGRDPVRAAAERGPRRLAADGARRARRPRARGLPRPAPRSGTFVSEPKIAQELTMTSFTEDMRRRGMQPGEPDARAADRPGRRPPRPPPARLAVGAGRRRDAAPARRRETMAIETLHVRAVARAGAHRATISRSSRSTSCFSERYGIAIVGGSRRSSRPSRTRRSRRRSACRCTRRRSSSSA